MKISELGHLPKEFAKSSDEMHTAKQKLMHGTEINRIGSGTKAAPAKRRRRGLADMLKLAAGAAAAAVVVAVSAVAAEPDIPNIPDDTDRPGGSEPDVSFVHPGDHDVPDNPDTSGTPDILPEYKYSYTISYPTYSVDISKGGYAVCLDISTAEKKQALCEFCADIAAEYLNFFTEYGDEYNEDETVYVLLRSETEDIDMKNGYASYIERIDYLFPNYIESVVEPGNGGMSVTGDSLNNTIIYKGIKRRFSITSEFSAFLYEKIKITDHSVVMENYGGLTRGEILEKVTALVDEYFSEPLDPIKTGVITENSLYFETMTTTQTFYVEEGEGRLILPEFFGVVRDM